MVKLRKAVDGSYFIVIRRALVESQAWRESDEMALLAVGSVDVIPKQGDYLLRKVGNGI
jgi:hypothetical protein